MTDDGGERLFIPYYNQYNFHSAFCVLKDKGSYFPLKRKKDIHSIGASSKQNIPQGLYMLL